MKKLTFGVLLIVVLGGQIWAASFTGFNAVLNVASVKDITLGATGTANMDSAGNSKVSFNVATNYDSYSIGAFGPGLVNTAQGHTLPLSVSCVPMGSAAGIYTALATSPSTTTIVASGTYSASATPFDLFIKASNIATAKAGYYGAYLNLKFTDGY